MTILTWVLPASIYVPNDDGTVTYTIVENTPVNFWGFMKAIPGGIQDGIALITMIFLIGACIGLVDSTGAIRAAMVALSRKLGEKNSKLVLIGVMIFFLCIGAFPSMLEGTIPFIPIGVAIALVLGYDVITGVAIIFVADIAGWTAGPTNFYTVGNAQTIGNLPLFSGLGYRMIVLVVLGIVTIWYVIRYAEKVKKDPTKSLVYGVDYSDLMQSNDLDISFTGRHKLVLGVFISTIIIVVKGCLSWKWGLADMSAAYIICAVICGFIDQLDGATIVARMMDGAKSVFTAAMAIGIARGISIVMNNGQIINTIIHALVSLVENVPFAVTGAAMVIVQCVINFFIPSGSSQALVTMPILMPMAEMVGLSKQVTILAFQIGDGLTNLCYPTMGATIACLAYARIPFDKWFKFIINYVLIALLVSLVLVVIATFIGY